MNHRHRTPRSNQPFGTALVGLCSFLALLLISSGSAAAAGAGESGGSVSYSIRLEVGVTDLQGGGNLQDLQGKSGTEIVNDVLVPNLRSSLTKRYQSGQVERIIRDVTSQAVVAIDGKGFSASPSQESWVASSEGAVHSL